MGKGFFVETHSSASKALFVISTERRNHTSESIKIGNMLYGVFCVISPFSRNDKYYSIIIALKKNFATSRLCETKKIKLCVPIAIGIA